MKFKQSKLLLNLIILKSYFEEIKIIFKIHFLTGKYAIFIDQIEEMVFLFARGMWPVSFGSIIQDPSFLPHEWKILDFVTSRNVDVHGFLDKPRFILWWLVAKFRSKTSLFFFSGALVVAFEVGSGFIQVQNIRNLKHF